jgi:hypothetical protein
LCAARTQEPGTTAPTRTSVTRDLEELARIASAMIDGDVCRRIMTRRSLDYLFKKDPRDPWAGSDNFDVNHEPYIQTKKTLIRLSRLLPYPCDVNLWMPIEGQPGKIQILLRNANEWSQFWTWGTLVQDLDPAMKRVLETGKRETITQKAGMISVLTPVYDSLGDIVALAEVVGMDPAVTPPQVHARLRRQGDAGIARVFRSHQRLEDRNDLCIPGGLRGWPWIR